MVANTEYRSRKQKGFTLIEVLVALVVGIISMVVVLQTFSASEANKRTATGGDDAQMAGALGLFQIERDLAQAGYGVSGTGIINCSVTLGAASGGKVIKMVPVTINPAPSLIPAGDTNTDTLLITYGNPSGPVDGGLIAQETAGVQNSYIMQTGATWVKGDYVIAAPNPPMPGTTITSSTQKCGSLNLDKITSIPASSASNTITVTTGVPIASMTPAGTYTLYDLGLTPVVVGYAVRNGSLTSCNYMVADCSNVANWSEVSGNISSLRALYGHDTNAGSLNGTVDTWDSTTPLTGNTLMCGWYRTLAVSVVLVARNNTLVTTSQNSNNGTFTGTAVTATAPVWQEPIWASGVVKIGGATVTSTTIDLSANTGLPSGTTWQNYRYKLYQTVAPLRNMSNLVGWLQTNTNC